MDSKIVAGKTTYAGLFLVTLCTLMFEILLTRIFSVTMWYHFAFMAISIAMFGMTVGAILVYLLPGYFKEEKTKFHMALSSFLFSLTIIISFLLHLYAIPFNTVEISAVNVFFIGLTYTVISIPFVFSGICVCLALTRFSRQISSLYAADLAGAGFGCILLILILNITDAPTAVFATAFIVNISTILFLCKEESRFKKIVLLSAIIMFLFIITNTILTQNQYSMFRLSRRGINNKPVRSIYEKWNSFSCISVWDYHDKPYGWGLSTVCPPMKIPQMLLIIDSSAETVITSFRGDLREVEYLKYDITSIGHYLMPEGKILIIGAGGGRDVLTALLFGQKSVIAVEINENIINTANKRYGDFTGHLDSYSGVTFVNDEARSYIARSEDKYDIIQASLIDTWAATASGAFVLTENSLYTVDCWKNFIEHLTPRGFLSISRWYFKERPGEVYRATSLAVASLLESGIEKPEDHIIIVTNVNSVVTPEGVIPEGIGTMLISKEPFSEEQLDTLEEVSLSLGFDIVLRPGHCTDETFKAIISGKKDRQFFADFPINITPPTDDSPFFFHMLRLKDAFKKELWLQGTDTANMKAVFVLVSLLAVVVVLTLLCIIIPLALTTKKIFLKGSASLFIFFAAIGFGFMFIEISQMQRLSIFLGHPIYGLSVVLFAFLISSGLGSFTTQKIKEEELKSSGLIRIYILLLAIVIFGTITPCVIKYFSSATTPVRILVSGGIIFPLGLFMGMAFPLGMKLASQKSEAITPWLWGINGSTSVCTSVLAVVVALSSSISVSYWIGFLCYVFAILSFLWSTGKKV